MTNEDIQHKELIGKMSLEDKFRFLTGVDSGTTYAMPELGVGEMRCYDGPSGSRVPASASQYAADASAAFSNAASEEAVATAFPSGCALGATWNRELMKEVGDAIGNEHKSRGANALLGPAASLKRHPLCGRNFEYLSEDPVLSGELGAAYVQGVQENGVAACPKHYIANNQERGRFSVSSEMDERTMREVYLAPFERIVKKSDPWSIMCSYNRINGVHASESKLLMDDILRQEWGFDGVIISDWGAVKNRAYSLKASVELCMPYQEEDFGILKDAYEKGSITDAEIDGAVDRLLTWYDRTKEPPEDPQIDFEGHHEIALRAAREAVTLLKNDGVLPLKKEELKRILVIGERAARPFIGGDGSSRVANPFRNPSPLEEIRRVVGGQVDVEFMGDDEINMYDNSVGTMEREVISKAAKADAVIVFVNQDYSCYSETMDRNDIELPPYLEHMIRAANRVNDKVIVVMNVGSAVSTYKWKHCANGILVSWLGGQGMGQAVAETLFGLNNPSGKLAETFPYRLEDVLSLKNYPGDFYKTEYNEKLLIGYRHFDTNRVEPEYEFGFGLSYTTFAYSGLELSADRVAFTVENTGETAGAEVAQVYISAPKNSWLSHPAQELKGFEKVFLQPGEKKRVEIQLEERDFQSYNITLHDWMAEQGTYQVKVGSSSRNLPLCGEVVIADKHPITFAPSPE